MLLQRLADFYERIEGELEPRHHEVREIDWIIELSAEGEFRGFIRTEGQGQDFELAVPYLRRAGTSPPPYLLVDKPAYVLGLGLDKWSDEKVQPRQEAFHELIHDCAKDSGELALEAIDTFLHEGIDRARDERPDDMSAGDLIGFSVDGSLPTRSRKVQQFWIDKMDARAAEKSDRTGQCLVCGRPDQPIADRHPVKLQLGPDRVQLITANENAFESYGLSASEIAPVCCVCAHVYGRALSYLFNSDRHSLRIASTTHVYWTREPEEFNPWDIVSNPTAEEVAELFKSAFRSQGVPELDTNDFYALSVSTYTSRLVVRNWLETTVAEVQKNLAAYFDSQRMVGGDGDDSYYPLRTLAVSVGRDFDSIPVQAEDALLACAIQGSPMPTQILHQVIQRARADSENRMTRPRAALIRLVFESQRSHGLIEEDREVTAELDSENRDPAYLCGRLLAVLERIQKVAIGAKATIVDRYFGTASSAPATVFGKLMRGAQNHLGKLRKNNKGAYYGLDRQLQEICTEIPEFPRTLSLQEQALFSLGYYHQKAADQRAASEGAAEEND
ncbi:MAG: type I-C CRISPR-associated protein Cas8c/Csd1 [Candidatus Brocadiia bacterium]